MAALVPWDFTATQLIGFKKTEWAIDNIFSYNFFQGNYYVRRELTAKDYLALFAPKYTENTFRRFGVRNPERPTFLPSNWTGSVDKLP